MRRTTSNQRNYPTQDYDNQKGRNREEGQRYGTPHRSYDPYEDENYEDRRHRPQSAWGYNDDYYSDNEGYYNENTGGYRNDYQENRDFDERNRRRGYAEEFANANDYDAPDGYRNQDSYENSNRYGNQGNYRNNNSNYRSNYGNRGYENDTRNRGISQRNDRWNEEEWEGNRQSRQAPYHDYNNDYYPSGNRRGYQERSNRNDTRSGYGWYGNQDNNGRTSRQGFASMSKERHYQNENRSHQSERNNLSGRNR